MAIAGLVGCWAATAAALVRCGGNCDDDPSRLGGFRNPAAISYFCPLGGIEMRFLKSWQHLLAEQVFFRLIFQRATSHFCLNSISLEVVSAPIADTSASVALVVLSTSSFCCLGLRNSVGKLLRNCQARPQTPPPFFKCDRIQPIIESK
jgi:hypothetical protein